MSLRDSSVPWKTVKRSRNFLPKYICHSIDYCSNNLAAAKEKLDASVRCYDTPMDSRGVSSSSSLSLAVFQ